MVVLMIDGHPLGSWAGGDANRRAEMLDAFQRELFEDAIPLVESLYRVEADRSKRAIAGLSNTRVLTQNIDGLHQKAGTPERKVLELHGSMHRTVCTQCGKAHDTKEILGGDKKCPECGSSYLIEKTLKSGVYLTCPNNKKPAAADEKASKRKKKGDEEDTGVACHYSKRLRDAPEAEAPAARSKKATEEAQPVA